MNDLRTPKTSFLTTPDGTRPRGRPRRRYQDMIDEDIKELRIKNWKTTVENRTEWRKLLWEAQEEEKEESHLKRLFDY